MLADRYKADGKSIMKLNDIQREALLTLSDKIKSARYHFEDIPCLICHGNDFELLSEKDRYGLLNKVVVCKKCGLVQNNPRLNQESYNDFYSTEYRPLYNGEINATDSFFKTQYFRGGLIYSFIKELEEFKRLKEPFVLEVGCGAGGILKAFQEKGCKVKGLDLGPDYLKFGKEKHGLDLEVGTIMSVKFDAKPDVIIYSHVLEHLTDPIAELNNIKNLLSPNGLLYIEVPGIKEIHKNYRCDFLLYLQNAHTYHFSFTTLKNIFLISGFEIIRGDEFIRTISRPVKIAADNSWENDYLAVKDYLIKTEAKRKMYPYTGKAIKESLTHGLLKVSDAIGVRDVLRKIRKKISG